MAGSENSLSPWTQISCIPFYLVTRVGLVGGGTHLEVLSTVILEHAIDNTIAMIRLTLGSTVKFTHSTT